MTLMKTCAASTVAIFGALTALQTASQCKIFEGIMPENLRNSSFKMAMQWAATMSFASTICFYSAHKPHPIKYPSVVTALSFSSMGAIAIKIVDYQYPRQEGESTPWMERALVIIGVANLAIQSIYNYAGAPATRVISPIEIKKFRESLLEISKLPDRPLNVFLLR